MLTMKYFTKHPIQKKLRIEKKLLWGSVTLSPLIPTRQIFQKKLYRTHISVTPPSTCFWYSSQTYLPNSLMLPLPFGCLSVCFQDLVLPQCLCVVFCSIYWILPSWMPSSSSGKNCLCTQFHLFTVYFRILSL